MNPKLFELATGIIGTSYVAQAQDARRRLENKIKVLLEQKKWPEEGWDDQAIEMLLSEFALMGSNNFMGNVGVGERESRIASGLVHRMHYRLGHGVGRSGDVAAIQPKAAGSSLIARIAESMALDLIKVCGVSRAKACIVLPIATGMTLVMTLLTLRSTRPTAKYVIWPRVDQKSCFKAIGTAGFIPIVIPNKLVGDEVQMDLVVLTAKLAECGPENVLAIVTTTSIFAPRAPDDVVGVAKLCKEHGVPHVVNNAYGIQASKYTHLLNEAIRVGRLDVFIQSTDKNLLVPVGGAIAAGPDKKMIASIGKAYPGRACAGPVLDVFITLLSLGSSGYKTLLARRKDLFLYLKQQMETVAAKHGERLLVTGKNAISIAMTLTTMLKSTEGEPLDIKFLGSMLFSRSVSGTRVVNCAESKEINGSQFQSYGAHLDGYPHPYLTAAAAIGMEKNEVDVFVQRLDKVIVEYKKKMKCSRASAEPLLPAASPADPVPVPAPEGPGVAKN